MRNSNFILLLALLVASHCYEYKSDCVCPSWDGTMVGNSSQPSQLSGFQLSNDNEVLNGVDYGKLIYYAGKIWLSQDVNAGASSSLPVRASCPAGYRVPTGDELRALLNAAKQDYASSPKDFLINQFKMNETFYYMTSEKTYPSLTNGGDNNAWRFTVLYFKDKITPQMDTPSVYWISSNLRVKCVLDNSNNDNKPDYILNFTKSLISGSNYSLDYQRNNVISNSWRVNGQVIGTTKKISWSPERAGCHVIESFLVIFGGSVIRQCKISWADLSFGSSYDTRLIADSIKNKVYSDFNANKVNSMHFNPSTAPIAARADGGAYILFAVKDTLDLYVRVTNNRGVDARTPIPLGKQGHPFDIVATPSGFVSLIRDKADSHFLYLLGNNEDGSQRFLRVIMNNGLDPNSIRDQIKFYNSDGTQVFGMAAMYRPHNGRLAFSQGRIHAIFAHYNHFGFLDNGNRNDHTGDTLVSFNEDGQDERLVNSWIASHSLFQNLLTTETKVVAASLGDAYPNNIKVTVADIEPKGVDPYTQLKNRVNSQSSDIISGYIPGNGGGASYGTLGGLSYLGNDLLAVTYQRKAGTTSYSSNSVNEVGIVFLRSNLTKVSQVTLADGKKVNIVKSAKYGANILIAMGTPVENTDYPQRHATPATDVMTLMVVSPTGSILSQSTVYTPYCLTANDDFEVLSDGSVVWGFVDANDKLNFYRIPTKSSTVLAQKKFHLKKKPIK